MRCIAYPGFKALILRKTMPQLRESHLKYIKHEIERELKAGEYLKTDSTAYFANGSTIKFGHCEDAALIETYLSAEYDLIFFDELAAFSLDQFLQISSSTRVLADSGRIALVRGAMNPIGPGASWIKEWFVEKSVDIAEHQGYQPDHYLYIHSTAKDNPFLDQAYLQSLNTHKGHFRKAWLLGEFVEEGQYFDLEESHYTDEPPALTPTVDRVGNILIPAPFIYRFLDWGWHDPTYCGWVAVYPNGRAIVFKERYWTHTTAAEIASDIRYESEGMRVLETFCDPSMFDGSAATGSSIGDVFEMNGVALTKSRNDRTAAGHSINEWLHTTLLDGLPKLQFYSLRCPVLVKTLPAMRIDLRNPGRIADDKHDHATIALGYFCQAASASPNVPKTPQNSWKARMGITPNTNRLILGRESVR